MHISSKTNGDIANVHQGTQGSMVLFIAGNGGIGMVIRKKIRIYLLAIKYWSQGDTWVEAVEYAGALVYGFKKEKSTTHG